MSYIYDISDRAEEAKLEYAFEATRKRNAEENGSFNAGPLSGEASGASLFDDTNSSATRPQILPYRSDRFNNGTKIDSEANSCQGYRCRLELSGICVHEWILERIKSGEVSHVLKLYRRLNCTGASR
jgi:hypothetical protein